MDDPQSRQIVLVRNFEIRPTTLTVAEGTRILLKVEGNARGYSQVYAEPRPFIFAVE